MYSSSFTHLPVPYYTSTYKNPVNSHSSIRFSSQSLYNNSNSLSLSLSLSLSPSSLCLSVSLCLSLLHVSLYLCLVQAVSLLRDPEGKFVLTSTETDGFPQPSSIVQRRNSSLEYGRSLNLNKGNEPNISSSLDRKNSYQVNSPEPISLSIIKDDLGTHHEDDFIKDDLGTHHEDSKGKWKNFVR